MGIPYAKQVDLLPHCSDLDQCVTPQASGFKPCGCPSYYLTGQASGFGCMLSVGVGVGRASGRIWYFFWLVGLWKWTPPRLFEIHAPEGVQ